MINETTLVQRCLEGDSDSFRILYETHVDRVYRFLKQFSPDHHEVEEWVQRAFIKAFERLDSFHERARFSTWIFTIALNEMRSDRRRATILQFQPAESSLPATQDNSAEEFQWNDLMRGWLSQLDETKRAVFLLYEVEGYSHAEIAAMLAIGESTSRTTLTRAKQWLREQWEQERRNTG